MKSKIIFALLLANAIAAAQELPWMGFVDGKVPVGFYKASIRYGEAKGDSLHIRWARAADADTFWVYKESLSLEYITCGDIRIAWYNNPMRYERRMATHHLREFILGSPLKFESLEGLARNRNPQFLEKSLREYFSK
jgi:hypothetical protein